MNYPLDIRLKRFGCKFLVILDTMWGHCSKKADQWFPINDRNFSGNRLYKLTGSRFPEVWVTNACRMMTTHATLHGDPSIEWLNNNLEMLPAYAKKLPLLVCGKVAKKVFKQVTYEHQGPILKIMHPAARTWTKRKIKLTQNKIARMI